MLRTISMGPRLVALATLASTLAVGSAAGAEETGGGPGDWLSSYAGARTLGLGGAFVATADDALGVVWNPAGLTQLYQNEAAAETARLFEDTSLHGVSFAVPGNRLPSFGVTVLTLRSSEFERTNELNDHLGTFGEGETAFLFTAAKAMSTNLSLGANLKVVRQSVEEWSGGGVGIDLGGLYHASPNLRIGAAVLNLGGPSIELRDTKETYPTEFRGGVALRVLDGKGLLTAQLDGLSDVGARLHAGAEYWIQPALALRVGYDDDVATGGFSYRFSAPFQADYGVADHALGMTHRVGVSYRFGGFFASSKADPAVFSPTGLNAVTKLHLKARTKARAESWEIAITDKNGHVVRRFGGRGGPPAHLLWDGKDEAGLPLADGIYRYHLVVHDAEGRRMESPGGSVEIFTGGPQGAVPVVPVE